MRDLTPLQHLTRAENLFTEFKRDGSMLSREHSDFLHHITQAMKGRWTSNDRKEMDNMLSDVVYALGIPGSMHGHVTGFDGFQPSDLFVNRPRTGTPTRDHMGRWCCDPDMMENGVPLVINWVEEEDRKWLLDLEYSTAYGELTLQAIGQSCRSAKN